MNSAWILGLSLLVVLIVGCLWKVRRDYQKVKRLTPLSVFLVWCLYLFHAGLVVVAAWRSVWALPLPDVIAVAAGLILALLGLFFLVAGIVALGSFERMSGMDTSKLITHGVYRWSRNPQNLGWGLCLLGVALLGNSGLGLLLAGLFWVMFAIYVPMEEKFLEDVYGDPYREYCAVAPRYFGWPRKS